jgi:hypothetical protein
MRRWTIPVSALLVTLGAPASADPPACVPYRFEHTASWEPFVCVRVEGTTGCPGASLRGHVSEESSGGRCSPEREALYTFGLPTEITSVASAHYTRDLELLFLPTAREYAHVLPDSVIAVAMKHGQVFRVLRGADFGVPDAGVLAASLTVAVQQSRAFTVYLAQQTAGGFRAGVLVEPQGAVLRVSRLER